MKLIRVFLSLSILFGGCYTQAPITRDEYPLDDCRVFFYLMDGSCVKSDPGDHSRKDGGYQVRGELVTGLPQMFDGPIQGADIKHIRVRSPNAIAKDGAVSDDGEVTFILQNDAQIRSPGGGHYRTPNGYHVIGELMSESSRRKFDGLVQVADIRKMTVEECDTVLTIVAIGVPVLIVGALLLSVGNARSGGLGLPFRMFGGM